MQPRELIDIERYPIEALDRKRGRELIQRCRRLLETQALCRLPGFVPADIARRMVQETQPAIPKGFVFETDRRAYTDGGNPWAGDQPRSAAHTCRYRQILSQISNDALIRRLFLWPVLTEFVRRVLGAASLYQNACPHFALTVQVSDQGDRNGWHFDGNDFVVSLLLQAPDSGGEFEYAPDIRNPDDENYRGVARVFADPDSHANRVALACGTFALVKGDFLPFSLPEGISGVELTAIDGRNGKI